MMKAKKTEGTDRVTEIRVGWLEVSGSGTVYRLGCPIRLPKKEKELLLYFLRHRGQLLTKKELYEAVWQLPYLSGSASVTVHIDRLREKLEPDPSHPVFLRTRWGKGYYLVSEDTAADERETSLVG